MRYHSVDSGMASRMRLEISFLFWLVILAAGIAAVISVLWLRSIKRRKRAMSLIDDLSQRGDELRAQVRTMLERHQYSTTTKSVMLLAYVDLALEHHAAIWLLRERELFGSAFALVRPLY